MQTDAGESEAIIKLECEINPEYISEQRLDHENHFCKTTSLSYSQGSKEITKNYYRSVCSRIGRGGKPVVDSRQFGNGSRDAKSCAIIGINTGVDDDEIVLKTEPDASQDLEVSPIELQHQLLPDPLHIQVDAIGRLGTERRDKCALRVGDEYVSIDYVAYATLENGKRAFACSVCNLKVQYRSQLRRHMRSHTGERPYGCDRCDAKFRDCNGLNMHMRVHTGEKPYSCATCNLSFTTSGNMKRHARMHTGERPYGCDTCGVPFAQLSSLITHRRLHSGERPFGCDVCGTTFTSSSNLKVHMRIHTGEKPYSCLVCDSRFSTSSYLKKHSIVHTRQKSFKCDVCLAKFTSSTYLNRHYKNRHQRLDSFEKV